MKIQFAAGIALGVGIGFCAEALLDPGRGAARRAKMRDKLSAACRHGLAAVQSTARGVGWRARGVAHELAARRHEISVPDEILEARVRSQLGRPVSHAHALEVHADHGRVKLTGRIPEREVPGLLQRVRHVRGVRQVDDALDVRPPAVPGFG